MVVLLGLCVKLVVDLVITNTQVVKEEFVYLVWWLRVQDSLWKLEGIS